MSNMNVMMRKDGRTIRDIPKPPTSAGSIKGVPINAVDGEPVTLIENEPVEKDGFSTIINCRWCGGKSREVYIPQLKNGKNGKPHEIVYNYDPCPECEKKWADMVVIFETTENEPYKDCLPINIVSRELGNGWDVIVDIDVPIYPTGRYVGITEEAALAGISDLARNGVAFFMEEDEFEDIFGKEFVK